LTVATFAVIGGLFPGAFPESNGFPSLPWAILILVTGFIYAGLGGYVTASLASRVEFNHLLALAVVVLILGILSTISSPESQPLWYQITLIILGIAGVMLGGMVRVSKKRKSNA